MKGCGYEAEDCFLKLECGREAKFNNTKADDVKYSQ